MAQSFKFSTFAAIKNSISWLMDFKKLIPHAVVLGLLFLLACVFFGPATFGDKVLNQSDNQQAKGMQTEVQKYLKETGEAPLWTNSAFGGMPAYQIYMPAPTNLTIPVFYGFLLGNGVTAPNTAIFLAMFCLYLLLLAFKTDYRIAAIGAATFGISVYNVDILEAGHSTKMIALAYLPAIFAGAIWAYRGRYLLGGGLIALFMCLEMLANHIQITYYGLLIIGLLFIAKLIEAVIKKHVGQWAIATSIIGAGLLVGGLSNASRLLPTQEFGQETIRGKSELSAKADKGDGLDKKYMFDWSCGIEESMTLLIPRYAGGGANESTRETDTYKKVSSSIVQALLQRGYSDSQARRQAEREVSGYLYTGAQPFVGTAIYYGAALLFLFFLGAFMVRGAEKWWLVGAAIFAVMLAWGGNFFLNHVFYDYMPLFKKFRAVTMAFGIGQLAVCALAALGLQEMFDGDVSADRKRKALIWSFSAVGGVCVLAILGSFVKDFTGVTDDSFGKDNPEVLKIMLADRASLMRWDAIRSLIFVLLAAVPLWFYLKKNWSALTALLAVGAITIADIWLVSSRTLSSSNYVAEKTAKADGQKLNADLQILADKDPHFRVFDLVRGGFTDNARTSEFHKSLSGYTAAKMALYQDMLETYFTNGKGINLALLGMLNAKYIINSPAKGEPVAMTNPLALGNAWFVKTAVTVPDADAELVAIGRFNPRDTMFVQEKNAAQIADWKYSGDSTDYIRLTSYHPDKMVYEFSAKSDQVAVFSEIYYPHEKGWNCYLNGSLMPNQIFKANYLLRGLRLPAGEKQVLEMRFEPKSVKTGRTITLICSLLSLLLVLGGLFFHFKKEGFGEANRLAEAEPVDKKEKPAAAPTVVEKKKKK